MDPVLSSILSAFASATVTAVAFAFLYVGSRKLRAALEVDQVRFAQEITEARRSAEAAKTVGAERFKQLLKLERDLREMRDDLKAQREDQGALSGRTDDLDDDMDDVFARLAEIADWARDTREGMARPAKKTARIVRDTEEDEDDEPQPRTPQVSRRTGGVVRGPGRGRQHGAARRDGVHLGRHDR